MSSEHLHCPLIIIIIIIIIFFFLNCNGNLLCYHGVVERNRISSLQSHGKALEKECCLPGVICDGGDKSIYIVQVRKGHKCAMSAEMAVWLRNCLYLYSYLSHN